MHNDDLMAQINRIAAGAQQRRPIIVGALRRTLAPQHRLVTLATREHETATRLARITTYSDGCATVAVENTDADTLHQQCMEMDLFGLRRLRQMVDGAVRDLEALNHE